VIASRKPLKNKKFKNYILDPLDEDSWFHFTQELSNESPFDLVLSCYGYLHDQKLRPEKRLKDVSLELLEESFRINTFTALFLAKHISPFMAKDHKAVLAFLSAKVGSIEDNRMGGWYSYRASKTALNMLVKNIAIEYGRKHKNIIVTSIHPGTTYSPLSEPFLEHFNLKIKRPEETARILDNTISNLTNFYHGKFINWDGSILPW
jgi:NAD(P)-dependent dehydrogenase (short-subunit alcohol dehydrogenase family)